MSSEAKHRNAAHDALGEAKQLLGGPISELPSKADLGQALNRARFAAQQIVQAITARSIAEGKERNRG